jgi:4-hydroxy-3-polyprenylbenzoate decarboxylase
LSVAAPEIIRFCEQLAPGFSFPLIIIIVVDDSDFTARNLNNFLWVTFTRSDPANDIHGVGSFVSKKHWGCRGSVVIDARLKPGFPEELRADPDTAALVKIRSPSGRRLIPKPRQGPRQ